MEDLARIASSLEWLLPPAPSPQPTGLRGTLANLRSQLVADQSDEALDVYATEWFGTGERGETTDCFGWGGIEFEKKQPVCAWIDAPEWESLNLRLSQGARAVQAARRLISSQKQTDAARHLSAASNAYSQATAIVKAWNPASRTSTPLPVETREAFATGMKALASSFCHCATLLSPGASALDAESLAGAWMAVGNLAQPVPGAPEPLAATLSSLRRFALRRACEHAAAHAFKQEGAIGKAIQLERLRLRLLEEEVWTGDNGLNRLRKFFTPTVDETVLQCEAAHVRERIDHLKRAHTQVAAGTAIPEFDESVLFPTPVTLPEL